jgi:hypothetical protein
MKVKGERRWVIADAEEGQVSIPQSWTETTSGETTRRALPKGGEYLSSLLELAKVVQTLQETHPSKEPVDAQSNPAPASAASRDPIGGHLVASASATPPATDGLAGPAAATTAARAALSRPAVANRGGGA